jgi:hypothetical protein
MSKEELAKFLAAVEQVRQANTASPEAARNFLEDEGYLNRDGSVADPYKSAQSPRSLHNLSATFVLGYHGCDRDVALALLNGSAQFTASQNVTGWHLFLGGQSLEGT